MDKADERADSNFKWAIGQYGNNEDDRDTDSIHALRRENSA
jgi:hypothetical protein